MILELTYYGNPVLRQKGAEISKIDAEIAKFVDDLLETMRHYDGVGLASQQVGKALQVAVVDVTGVTERPSRMWIANKEVNVEEHMPVVLINPKLELIKTKEIGSEGCLSFPEVTGEISRSKRVKVTTQQLDGSTLKFEADGLLGRAIQHEYDHLQGVLFIDRMDAQDRAEQREAIEAVKNGKRHADTSSSSER